VPAGRSAKAEPEIRAGGPIRCAKSGKTGIDALLHRARACVDEGAGVIGSAGPKQSYREELERCVIA
jgi:hypothetical protein